MHNTRTTTELTLRSQKMHITQNHRLRFAWKRCLEKMTKLFPLNGVLMLMNPMIESEKNHQKQTKPSKVVSKYNPRITQKMTGFGKSKPPASKDFSSFFGGNRFLQFRGCVPWTMKHCRSGTWRLVKVPHLSKILMMIFPLLQCLGKWNTVQKELCFFRGHYISNPNNALL